jgi:hypothetical protein
MSSAARVLASIEGSRKLYGAGPEAIIRRGPVQEYPDAESLVRSFGASTAIGKDGKAEILRRMRARQREALRSSDADVTLRRRPIYPGGNGFWRTGGRG